MFLFILVSAPAAEPDVQVAPWKLVSFVGRIDKMPQPSEVPYVWNIPDLQLLILSSDTVASRGSTNVPDGLAEAERNIPLLKPDKEGLVRCVFLDVGEKTPRNPWEMIPSATKKERDVVFVYAGMSDGPIKTAFLNGIAFRVGALWEGWRICEVETSFLVIKKAQIKIQAPMGQKITIHESF